MGDWRNLVPFFKGLMENQTDKQLRIFICTNILTEVKGAAYVSHCNFWFRNGKLPYKFFSMTPPRMAIDQARNWAARMALELDCDYLMFLDDDMIIVPDTLSSLIEADLDVVMAHTYIRGYPFNVMAFKKTEKKPLEYFNDWKDHVNEKGIYLCDAVGFAVCLIKTSLLKKMEAPFFVTGTGHTEDVYFCMKAKAEIGEDVSIGVDTKVPTGHLLREEAISLYTLDKLKAYYEPAQKEEVNNGDRSEIYYRQLNQVLGE